MIDFTFFSAAVRDLSEIDFFHSFSFKNIYFILGVALCVIWVGFAIVLSYMHKKDRAPKD